MKILKLVWLTIALIVVSLWSIIERIWAATIDIFVMSKCDLVENWDDYRYIIREEL